MVVSAIYLTLNSVFTFNLEGYGNIAPKTSAGRVFCIFYGLFGVPLCLTWISELGKFFGGRAKHLGQYLTKKGFSLVRWYVLYFPSCLGKTFASLCGITKPLTWSDVFFFLFQRKAQFTCTAIFLLWGVLVHLVLPPFVFMSQEGWTYIEGLYFSFVTLTTIGFGDLVAGKLGNKYPHFMWPWNL